MTQFQSRWLALALVLAGSSCKLFAVDGVILIDQNRALAGNVTPGDAPGFPVTITQPGSYRLAGNLTVPNANTTAILVNSEFVTIDLNGFDILGPTFCVGKGVCTGVGTGIGVDGNSHGVTVVNGGIHGMGNDGINVGGGAFASGSKVDNVHADANGGSGITLFGGTASGNTANNNGANGIIVDGTASGNIADKNRTAGIAGIVESTIKGNRTLDNGSYGIRATCPSSVVDNTASRNGLFNIATNGPSCVIDHNAAP